MSKNLVLTAAVGYNFAQVELFIKSLRKYHVGPIAIIIDENNYDLKKNLRINDCDIIETNSNKKKIQFMRYKIFINYLSDKTFDKILLCDSRDIYFQNDPFNYNYHGNCIHICREKILEQHLLNRRELCISLAFKYIESCSIGY